MEMNNYFSPGYDVNNVNYENYWETHRTYVHSQIDINAEIGGQDSLIHCDEADENCIVSYLVN